MNAFLYFKGPNFSKGEWITPDKSVSSGIAAQLVFLKTYLLHLTITPRARMGSESIAHEAFGLMGY